MKTTKNKIIVSLLCLLLSYSAYSQCDKVVVPGSVLPACQPVSYELEFEDHFNGTYLDTNVWEPIIGVPRNFDFSETKAWHNEQSIVVSNGTVKIIGEKHQTPIIGTYLNTEVNPNQNQSSSFYWTTGEVWTKPSLTYGPYGKYEIRCKLPNDDGCWPAFWTYTGNSGAGGVPWNEIDVFDNLNGADVFNAGLRYDYDNDGNPEDCGWSRSEALLAINLSDWHTYTFIYNRYYMKWLIDGLEVKKIDRFYELVGGGINCSNNDPNVRKLKSWPDLPMQIVFNMAIKSGNDEPSLPIHSFEVDYIKFWKEVPSCGVSPLIDVPFDGYPVGDNVTFESGAMHPVATGNTEVKAMKSIHIKSQFYTNGHDFSAIIDPDLCDFGVISGSRIITGPDDDLMENSQSELLKYNIYPNPHNGQFNVSIDNEGGAVTIQVFDLMGKQVYSENAMNNAFSIDISDQPRGVYLVKLTVGDQLFTEKIIYQ